MGRMKTLAKKTIKTSTARERLLKRASALTGIMGGSPAERIARVRAQDLLDEAEAIGAVRVEYIASDDPDTSWMDASQLRDYRDGDLEFVDTMLWDRTTDDLIGSLSDSCIGSSASDREYLRYVALNLVSEHKDAVVAAIKRARKRIVAGDASLWIQARKRR
jgi:hypothetical protein